MTPAAVQQLLDRYISEELSKDEFGALWQTLSEEEHLGLWEQQTDALLQSGGFEDLADPAKQQLVLASILHEEKRQAPLRRLPSKKIWWAAASVVLMLAAGAYFWFITPEKKSSTAGQLILPNDLPPGKEGAILTLADGTSLLLDSIGTGWIATENGTSVILKNNELSYSPVAASSDSITYNTLSTPRGRQFHVKLPDGTAVWLNAASSIRYPTVFTGKERKVTITGEAYLEVAKDQRKPFIVDVDGEMEVEVLGTSFNVNAYTNEPQINTTLLEGSIKVAKAATEKNTKLNSIQLSPGQQAAMKGEELLLMPNPDLKMVMAWKEGYFLFNYTPVDEILRQFARWYDMEVVYEDKAPDFVLSGAIRRDFTLTEAMLTLEKMGLHYRLEGKQLTILK
jgi:transmembrane sensor